MIVRGEGRRLKVRPVSGSVAPYGKEKRWLPLQVQLRKDHRTRLTVTVESTGPYPELWKSFTATVELRPDRRGER